MRQAGQRPRILGFGVFELDLQMGELRRQGAKVPLQEQPLRLLGLLLERPGDLISREEIETQLWPGDTYGDLDHRLNNTVNKIRIALDDPAENPRFLETIKRRGYRFMAPVHEVGTAQEGKPSTRPALRSWVLRGATGALLLATAIGLALWLSSGARSGPVPDKIMLAVLPFRNIGSELTEDYLADGLTEEVILQLGQLRSSELGVIARTSVMPYKTTQKGIRRIGQELGVDYILEGSVRQELDQLRITTQLVGVDDQTPLWAESYNRTREDVFSFQRDVADRVSTSLALAVLPPTNGRPTAPTKSRVAHQAYLKARYFRDQGTEEGFYRATDYFRLAIAEDPLYARAYAGLASCQCLLAGYGLEVLAPDEAMPKAREFAEKALGLDAGLAEAHAVMGMVRMKYEWDFAGAEESFLRALQLNPSYAQAHSWYSIYLEAMERREEALLQARRALELNPISKGAAANLAMQLANAGRFEEASAEIAEALELDEGFWGAHWVLGNLHAKQAEALLKELQDLGKERYLSPAFSGDLRRSGTEGRGV